MRLLCEPEVPVTSGVTDVPEVVEPAGVVEVIDIVDVNKITDNFAIADADEATEPAEESAETEISVEVTVNAPLSTKVNVKVDITQGETASSTQSPSGPKKRRTKERDLAQPKKHYKPHSGGPGYWALCGKEGSKASKRYNTAISHTLNLPYLTADYPGAIQDEALFDDPRLHSYEELLDRGDMDVAGFSPTKRQIEVYYQLRRFCDLASIDYNRRDIPETGHEYVSAIMALERLRRQYVDMHQHQIIPIKVVTFDSDGRATVQMNSYRDASKHNF